jgi:S-adenosylmethionine-dependent methyltransferase
MLDNTPIARLSRQERMRAIARAFRPKPAPHLLARQKPLTPDSIAELSEFVRANFKHPPSHWETPDGRLDLRDLAGGRLAEHRATYIPWLDSIRPLNGLRVLEIGCGTGSSTVAMAEQGAEVTGVDMEEAPLKVARRFCEWRGVQARFLRANAAEAHEALDIGSYDLIVFFAVLEHMTSLECLASLSAYWRKMRPGALLGALDTPNRLWLYDAHTSYLPFFHWLPGEIAVRYAAASTRPNITALHKNPGAENILELQRWGRGISYHEFELAIAPVAELPIVSSLGRWRRRHDIAQLGKWLVRDYAFHRMLRLAAGGVPAAWFEPFIDLVIRRVDTPSPPLGACRAAPIAG